MRVWTVHVRGEAVVLVPERFSVAATVFGPLWLLAHRAWIPAVLLGCALSLVAMLAPGALKPALLLALAWLAGLHGQDLRRWSLARHGYRLAQVVAGRDAGTAMLRLFDQVPPLPGGGPAGLRPA